jgi:hypothetical protein
MALSFRLGLLGAKLRRIKGATVISLDHIVVSATTLDDGHVIDHLLGVPLQAGGEHVSMGTHNRLLGLGRDYLEVIAIDPERRWIDRARWYDLDRFRGPPRLTHWVCRTRELANMAAHVPESLEILDFERNGFRWRMAVPHSGRLPYDGLYPALIEWHGDHPAAHLTDRDCRLMRLEVCHPLAAELGERLSPWLDEPRLRFVTQPEPQLRALIATPSGEKLLT